MRAPEFGQVGPHLSHLASQVTDHRQHLERKLHGVLVAHSSADIGQVIPASAHGHLGSLRILPVLSWMADSGPEK